MVNWQFIFLITALIISDAVANECKLQNKEFCDLIGDAHKANVDGLKLMNGALNGNGRKALKLADERVVEVLKAGKEQLITALKAALTEQLNAYLEVKADCNRRGHNYDGRCEEVLFEVAYATLGLIIAIAEVHPDAHTKTNLEDILEALYPHMFDANASVYRDKLHESGKKVLEIIEAPSLLQL